MIGKTALPFSAFLVYSSIGILAQAQYYAPPNLSGAVGCVVTGDKLYSHGNYIRDLNSDELQDLDNYKKNILDFKEKVNAVYANFESVMQRNGTLPTLPVRPQMPAFCVSNETTLYILGGCTLQNYKVYIAGKFARELNAKEKEQLDQFAKQMVTANYAAAQAAVAAAAAAQNPLIAINGTFAGAPATQQHMAPLTTTISPATEVGRQIALDFCTEF